MSQDHKKKILFLAGITLLLLLFLPIFLTEPRVIKDQSGGSFLRNIIFDFQSLITGVLAVLAAAGTVWQMMRTDEASERRHRELVSAGQATEAAQEKRHQQLFELSLRKDRLLVERATVPHLQRLLLAQREIATLTAYLVMRDETDDRISYIEKYVDAFDAAWIKVSKVLRDLQFNSAKQLFGGNLSSNIATLDELDERVSNYIRWVKTQTDQGMHINNLSFMLDNLHRFVSDLKDASRVLDDTNIMLHELAERYRFSGNSTDGV